MLVAAFKVHVGVRAGVACGPHEIGPAPAFKHEGVSAAAVEPHIENVGDAFIIRRVTPRAEIFGGAFITPCVDPIGHHGGDDAGVDLGIVEILAGLAVDKQRDRHAPGALAAEHPVGPPFDHRTNPVAALFGHKPRGGDGGNSLFAQGFAGRAPVHRHEPLGRAAVDHLGLGAPRMGVGVLVVSAGRQQAANLAQGGADRAIGGVELGVDDRALAAQPRPIGAILAIALDRELRLQPVRLAQVKIVLAMVGRHVDQAGAAVGGDKVARQEGPGPREEAAEVVHRVAGDGAGEVGAFVDRGFTVRSKFARQKVTANRFLINNLDAVSCIVRVHFCEFDGRDPTAGIGHPRQLSLKSIAELGKQTPGDNERLASPCRHDKIR